MSSYYRWKKPHYIELCFFSLDHYSKLLLNTVLNSATARQLRNTIFKILSILSQSVQSIRLSATLSQFTKKLLNIYIETRKGYVALATYGRVALILRTSRVIECDVKC